MHIKGPSTDMTRSNVRTAHIDRISTSAGMRGSQHIAELRFFQDDGKEIRVICDDYEEIVSLVANAGYIARYARKAKRARGELVPPPDGHHLCPKCGGKGEVKATQPYWMSTMPCLDCEQKGEIENPPPDQSEIKENEE